MNFIKTGHVGDAEVSHESFIIHEIIAAKSAVDECVRSTVTLSYVEFRPTNDPSKRLLCNSFQIVIGHVSLVRFKKKKKKKKSNYAFSFNPSFHPLNISYAVKKIYTKQMDGFT